MSPFFANSLLKVSRVGGLFNATRRKRLVFFSLINLFLRMLERCLEQYQVLFFQFLYYPLLPDKLFFQVFYLLSQNRSIPLLCLTLFCHCLACYSNWFLIIFRIWCNIFVFF